VSLALPSVNIKTTFFAVQATYCVKMTGVFEGMLGTKRFCSSRDWGNYCEYIQRPGDIQVTVTTLHRKSDLFLPRNETAPASISVPTFMYL
jgi:hypothetical protein